MEKQFYDQGQNVCLHEGGLLLEPLERCRLLDKRAYVTYKSLQEYIKGVIMRPITRAKLDKLAKNGAFTMKDARKLRVTPRTIYRLCSSGDLVRISRGLYQVANSVEDVYPEYSIIAKRVPKAVLCLTTALYHHELTTEIPRVVHIAIPRNSHVPRLGDVGVKVHRLSEKVFRTGILRRSINGVKMRIYSAEKTIADCFKYRHVLGLEICLEALKLYLAQPRNSPTKLLEAAKVCRVSKTIGSYLEALL